MKNKKTAAPRISPECPVCRHKATYYRKSDQMLHCKVCGNEWPAGSVFKQKAS